MNETDSIYDDCADQTVDLGNHLANEFPDDDIRDIADGLLSGAVHFWLYAYQPPEQADRDEDWQQLDTAEKRMRLMIDQIRQAAESSEYFHSPNDRDVGRA